MPLELEILLDGRLLDCYAFTGPAEQTVLIGRHETCDVNLDHEGVSRRHCEITAVPDGGGHLLRDLGSSNGTYVKGRKIKVHSLNPNDTFSVCGLTIRYLAKRAKLKAEIEPELGIPVPDLTFKVDKSVAAQKVRTSRFSRLKGYLLVGTGTNERNYVLHESLVLIGSDPDAGIRLDERGAPRVAAMIVREDTCFRAVDASPKGNWLKVNGAFQAEVALQRGDDIELGQLRIKYFSGLPKLRPKQSRDEGTKRWKPKR